MDDAVFVVDHTGAVALTNAALERLLGPAEATFVPQDEDVMAEPICYLCSHASDGVTGARIVATEFATWLRE